jgi:hypothetical protein
LASSGFKTEMTSDVLDASESHPFFIGQFGRGGKGLFLRFVLSYFIFGI